CSSTSGSPSSGAPVPPASAGTSSAPGTLTDAQVEVRASSYKAFAKINRMRYPTRQHLGNPLVDVYASPEVEALYRTVDFGQPYDGGVVQFPAASMLVKPMYDDSGEVSALTVMYKRASGYDPTHGDWWYGRLNPDGSPTDPAYTGKIDFCIACHAAVAR